MVKYQVRVLNPPADQDKFARALRLVARLDIKEAHDLAQYVMGRRDIVILAGVDAHVAEYITETLRDAGADVATESSSIEHPMLCTPDANVIYEWGAMRTVKPRREKTTRHHVS